jgi:hypothetical protein
MRRGSLLTLPILLIPTSLTGCGIFDGSSSLEDALEVMPGDVDRVTFFDREAAVERVGDDLEQLPSRTELDRYLSVMLEDAPFSAADIDWEVVGYVDDSFGRAWRMNDDLDLDDVADDLVELGYEQEDDSGDLRTLEIGLDQVDDEHPYLLSMQSVTIVPDEHLIITGPLGPDLADVVADDEESAVDTGAFEDLVDSTDDVEVADLVRDDTVCALGEARLSPEQLAASGVTELGRPDETAFFVYGDEGETRSVLRFADDGAAEDDADAREEFLADGTSPISGVPYSEFGDFAVEADGDQVRIDIDYDDPRDVSAVVTRRDYPSVCVPD